MSMLTYCILTCLRRKTSTPTLALAHRGMRLLNMSLISSCHLQRGSSGQEGFNLFFLKGCLKSSPLPKQPQVQKAAEKS